MTKQMQDSSALDQVKPSIQTLFLKTSAKEILQECLHAVQQTMAAKARFNVLDARNAVEDILETFEERTGLNVSTAFEKLSKKFVKHVKAADEIEAALLADLAESIDDNLLKHAKEEVIRLAVQKEVNRFLDVICKVPDMQAQWNSELPNVLQSMKKALDDNVAITKTDLVDWASSLQIKGVLPLLAMIQSTTTGEVDTYFSVTTHTSPSILGMPTVDTDTLKVPDESQWKLRTAKIEPISSKRLVIASNGHLLIWNDDSASQVPMPEPLAHHVAVIPGLDLPEDRAMVFVADPKTHTGGIVQIRLFGPLKRIATFDLEVPAGRRDFSFISSERDANGNILLTWGALEDNGTLDWSLHACILEDNLIEDNSFRRDSAHKLVFEDFGEPVERSSRRQDFRDHGNRLSLVLNQASKEYNVVSYDTKIATASPAAVSIFGYPLAYFVANRFKTIDRYIYESPNVTKKETLELDWPQAITCITVV